MTTAIKNAHTPAILVQVGDRDFVALDFDGCWEGRRLDWKLPPILLVGGLVIHICWLVLEIWRWGAGDEIVVS